ncbi:hypothetical protein CDAR_612281 [Caerostris darwini]|uniref:Uncharacterized protein n=1 Tax=Caerostris darwini TaxID=1538125 RepID=A0AAV4S056_9ARAC|nr:hypothetical protein CDAR_612281 [Caerostris darwini]
MLSTHQEISYEPSTSDYEKSVIIDKNIPIKNLNLRTWKNLTEDLFAEEMSMLSTHQEITSKPPASDHQKSATDIIDKNIPVNNLNWRTWKNLTQDLFAEEMSMLSTHQENSSKPSTSDYEQSVIIDKNIPIKNLYFRAWKNLIQDLFAEELNMLSTPQEISSKPSTSENGKSATDIIDKNIPIKNLHLRAWKNLIQDLFAEEMDMLSTHQEFSTKPSTSDYEKSVIIEKNIPIKNLHLWTWKNLIQDLFAEEMSMLSTHQEISSKPSKSDHKKSATDIIDKIIPIKKLNLRTWKNLTQGLFDEEMSMLSTQQEISSKPPTSYHQKSATDIIDKNIPVNNLNWRTWKNLTQDLFAEEMSMLSTHQENSSKPSTSDYEQSVIIDKNIPIKNLYFRAWKNLIQDLFAEELNMLSTLQEISSKPSTSDYEKSATDIIDKNIPIKNLHLRAWKNLIQDLFAEERDMLSTHQEISSKPSTSDYEKSATDIIDKNIPIKNLHLRAWKNLIRDLFAEERDMLSTHQEISSKPSTRDYEKSATDIIDKNIPIKNLHLRAWKNLIQDLFAEERDMLSTHQEISSKPSTSDYEKSATDIIDKSIPIKNLHLRAWKTLIRDLFAEERDMLSTHQEISSKPSTSDHKKSATDIIDKNIPVNNLNWRTWKNLTQDLFAEEMSMLSTPQEISSKPSTSDHEKSVIIDKNIPIKNLHLRTWKNLIQDLFAEELNMLSTHQEISSKASTSDHKNSATDIIDKIIPIKNVNLRTWKNLTQDLFDEEMSMLRTLEEITSKPQTSDHQKSATDIIDKNSPVKKLNWRAWKNLTQDLFAEEMSMLSTPQQISSKPSTSDHEKSATDIIDKKIPIKNLYLRAWKNLIQDLFAEERDMLSTHQEISSKFSTSDYEKSVIIDKNVPIKNLNLKTWKNLTEDLVAEEISMLSTHQEITSKPPASDHQKSATDNIDKNIPVNNLNWRTWKNLTQDLFAEEMSMLSTHQENSSKPSTSDYEQSVIIDKNIPIKNLYFRAWKNLIQDLFAEELNMLSTLQEISSKPSTSDYEKSATDIIDKNIPIKNLHLRAWKNLIQDLFAEELNMLSTHQEISSKPSTSDHEKSATDIIDKNILIKNLNLRAWKNLIQDLFAEERDMLSTHQEISSKPSTSDYEKSASDIIDKNIPIKNLHLRAWKNLIQDLFAEELNMLSTHQEISSKPSTSDQKKSATDINDQNIPIKNLNLRTWKNLTQDLFDEEMSMLSTHQEISSKPSTSDYEKSATDIIDKNIPVKNLNLRTWKNLIQDLFAEEMNMLSTPQEISSKPSTSDHEKSATDIIDKNILIKNLHLRTWKNLIQDLFAAERDMLRTHQEISSKPSTIDYEKSVIIDKNIPVKNLNLRTLKNLTEDLFAEEMSMLSTHQEITSKPPTSDHQKSATDIIDKNIPEKNLNWRTWKNLTQDLFAEEMNMLSTHQEISPKPSTRDHIKSAADNIDRNIPIRNMHLRAWKNLIRDLFAEELNMLSTHQEISTKPSTIHIKKFFKPQQVTESSDKNIPIKNLHLRTSTTSDHKKSPADNIDKYNRIQNLHFRAWKNLIQDLFAEELNMLNTHQEISSKLSTSAHEKSATDIIDKNIPIKNLHLRAWKNLIQDLFAKELNMLSTPQEISSKPSTSDHEKSATDIIDKNILIKNLHLRTWTNLIQDLFAAERDMLRTHQEISSKPSTSDYEKYVIIDKNIPIKNLHLRRWKNLMQDLFAEEMNMLSTHQENLSKSSTSDHKKSPADNIDKNIGIKNLHFRAWKNLIQDLFAAEMNMLSTHQEISSKHSTSDYEKPVIIDKNVPIKNLNLRTLKNLTEDLFAEEMSMLSTHQEITSKPPTSDHQKSATDIIDKSIPEKNLNWRIWKNLTQDLFAEEMNMLSTHQEISPKPSTRDHIKSAADNIDRNIPIRNMHFRSWKNLIRDLFAEERDMLSTHQEISSKPSTIDYEKSVIIDKNIPIKNLNLRAWKNLIQDLFADELNMLSTHQEISSKPSTSDYGKSVIIDKTIPITNLNLRAWKNLIQDLFAEELNMLSTHQEISPKPSTSDNEKSVTDIINRKNIPIKNLHLRAWKNLIRDLFAEERDMLSTHQEILSKTSTSDHEKSVIIDKNIPIKNFHLRTWKNLIQDLFVNERNVLSTQEKFSFTPSTSDYEKSITDIIYRKIIQSKTCI